LAFFFGPFFGLGFFGASTAGTATIINNNNGLIYFDTPFSNDTSSADHATIVNQGGSETDFNAFSTAGNATITTNSGAATVFFDNSTGGLARFIVNGSGVLNFSSTAGLNGDGQISAGSIEGNGQVFIGSNNTLSVGGNNLSTEFSGVIADGCGCGPPGAGSLVKVGTGTLILSGVNSYTDTTDVNGGTLVVNGSIASSSLTRVNNGGTLAGTGTVGNTQVNNGGTLAPGNSPGTITVQGNLAFQSGAFYLVQLNPTTASFANVSGTASLAGTVNAVFAPGSYLTKTSYDILHATGGLGGTTFASLIGVPPNFNATLSYTSTDVFLNLTAALGNGTPLNQNQQSVANAINAFFNNGGTLPSGFAALFNLTDGNLANALTLLSGEVATGAQQPAFQLMNEFLGIMLDPFVDGRAGVGGISGGVSRFAPDRGPLPEDIALAYSKVLRTPVYKAIPFEQR
jgi:autotransporter-associated beta strand protein